MTLYTVALCTSHAVTCFQIQCTTSGIKTTGGLVFHNVSNALQSILKKGLATKQI